MACVNCRREDVERDQAFKEAKRLAQENGVAYAVYFGNEKYEIILATTAIEQHYPIIQIFQ